jgi:hypothetical protein
MRYSSMSPSGFAVATPIARVWASPVHVALPVADFLGDLVADAGADQCITPTQAASGVMLDASDDQGNVSKDESVIEVMSPG